MKQDHKIATAAARVAASAVVATLAFVEVTIYDVVLASLRLQREETYAFAGLVGVIALIAGVGLGAVAL